MLQTLVIDNDSENYFIIIGDTKVHTDNLRKLGGRTSHRTPNRWVFDIDLLPSVEKYIRTGIVEVNEHTQLSLDKIKLEKLKRSLIQLKDIDKNYEGTSLTDIIEYIEQFIRERYI